jgi:hypothetical protein
MQMLTDERLVVMVIFWQRRWFNSRPRQANEIQGARWDNPDQAKSAAMP